MAAPVGGQVLSEVLPYLQVVKDNQTEEEQVTEVEVPSIVGKTIKEAKEILKEVGLEMEVEQEEADAEQCITEQLPKPGISLRSDNKVWASVSQ